MHSPELSDGLVIGNQPPQQPQQFDVAPALRFQPSRRTHLMQISVQVQLQQVSRIIARSSRVRRFGAHKSQLFHVQPTYESFDHPADMIAWNQLLQRDRKQCSLIALLPLDETHLWWPSLNASSHPFSIRQEFRNRLLRVGLTCDAPMALSVWR